MIEYNFVERNYVITIVARKTAVTIHFQRFSTMTGLSIEPVKKIYQGGNIKHQKVLQS
jgi:hypothetical protein